MALLRKVFIIETKFKLSAIKFLKYHFDIRLKEAKDLIDTNLPQYNGYIPIYKGDRIIDWGVDFSPVDKKARKPIFTGQKKEAKAFMAALKAECPDAEFEVQKVKSTKAA